MGTRTSQVVSIVDFVIGLHNVLHVAVERDVLAATRRFVIHLVAEKREVVNRSRRLLP